MRIIDRERTRTCCSRDHLEDEKDKDRVRFTAEKLKEGYEPTKQTSIIIFSVLISWLITQV